jgi:hypothetical protein
MTYPELCLMLDEIGREYKILQRSMNKAKRGVKKRG